MARYLLPPSPLMQRDVSVSATSERGSAIRRAPQPDDANVGALNLTARHALREVTPEALTFEVEGGGNPDGYTPGGPTTSNGCRVKWWPSDESSSTARGWVDRPFTRYADCANPGEDYGPLSAMHQSETGRVGFVAVDDNGGTLRLRFAHKSSRFADWTQVTVTDNASAVEQLSTQDQRPALLITDAGRWIAYAVISSPYASGGSAYLAGWYSDDDGDTWALLNDSCLEAGYSDHDAVWVNGAVALVGSSVGGCRAYHSTSEGVAFSPAGSSTGTYNTAQAMRFNDSVLVFADDGSETYMATITPGGRLDDDAVWTEVFGSTFGQRIVWVDDQGVLWGLGNQNNTNGSSALYASTDGGLSWTSAMFESAVFGLSDNNLSPAQTIENFTACMMGATVVFASTSNVSTSGSSGADGQVQCLYLGGWDVGVSEEGWGEGAGDSYFLHVWPITTPTNQGWTATNVGAGSTVTIADGKINMVATGSDNTDFSIPSAWAGGGQYLGLYDGARLRFVANVNSGGSVVASRAYVRIQLSSTTGAFWLVLRLSSTQIRAVDNSGTLATASLIGAMSSPVEFWVRMVRGDPYTTCTASVLYRAQSAGDDGAWNTLLAQVSISNDTGSSGNDLRFGGAAAGAVDWDLQWLALATDHNGLEVGSTALGRPLSNAAPMYAYSGVSVGAYGTSGVEGDTYTLTEVAAFPASAVWGSGSPSEQCQSTDDTALWRVVFDMGDSDEMWGDIVAAFGTNVATFKVMANATDSWGSPSQSVTVDASIRAESLDGVGPGWANLDIIGSEMTPHEFATKPGHRYMVAFAGTGNAYEITDNTDTTLICRGQDLSGESGTATIYKGAGWGDLDLDEMRYLAFEVAANEPNPDGYFSLGALPPSQKVSMNAGDGSDVKYGYSRGTRIPVQIEEAADGYQAATVIGGPQEVLVLPMLESVQALRDWSHEVASLLRYLGGPGSVVAFIGDSSVSHMHRNGGLYRVQGTEFTETHIYGTDTEQRWRAPTIRLVEVT